MDWSDNAIVLDARKHSENDVILDVITPGHGRARGYVAGGSGRRLRGVLQPGNQISVTWRARVETNLGRFAAEPVKTHLAAVYGEEARLLALSAVCAMTLLSLPEREQNAPVYQGLRAYLDFLCEETGTPDQWGRGMVLYELGLLKELGFGLDFSACAATGVVEDLIYVSPKSGRAVSREAGEQYREKLLRLPAFLAPQRGEEVTVQDILAGLSLTGHFLRHNVLVMKGNGAMPQARERFIGCLEALKPDP